MAVQPLPAVFKTGTEVTRVDGLPGSVLSIVPGVITRTTKTLAEVTFSPDGPTGRTYMRTYHYTARGTVAEPYLSIKSTYAGRELDEVYLSGATRVADAHKQNATLAAQRKVLVLGNHLRSQDARWINREQVEEYIALLTAQLDALPTRTTL